MSGTALGSREVDLNGTVGDVLATRIDVNAVQRLHVEMQLVSGTWGTAVLELEKSPSGSDFYSFAPVIEFTGEGVRADIDVHDAQFATLELTTGEGAAGVALFFFYGDGYDAVQTVAVATFSDGYATRIDEASATITYVGKAAPGTGTSAGTWQIQRLTDTGSGLTVEWADGDDEFDNVYDNRASLSYS